MAAVSSSWAATGAPGDGPRVCLVGPLPPPSGGMANQCEQLLRLMAQDGVAMTLVRTNPPYQPEWVGRLPLLRALFRLLPFLWQLWRGIGRADVVHIFANSGWSWHLIAAPALAMARWRGVGAIVNYRGGHADTFFATAPRWVLRSLASARLRVTPSAYLLRVFARHGLEAEIIPNIVDLSRFRFAPAREFGKAPHLIVTRNLEDIYDIPTALRAFTKLRQAFPEARLTVAGTGPQRATLERMAVALDLTGCVNFCGRIDNQQSPHLYASADGLLNPSTVDNMPISLLEAMACGVPFVSTDAGGIPDLVDSGRTGWLVPVGDDTAMAERMIALLNNPAERVRMCEAARQHVAAFAWPEVRDQWLRAYRHVAALGATA